MVGEGESELVHLVVRDDELVAEVARELRSPREREVVAQAADPVHPQLGLEHLLEVAALLQGLRQGHRRDLAVLPNLANRVHDTGRHVVSSQRDIELTRL